jgi:hypothetical protein
MSDPLDYESKPPPVARHAFSAFRVGLVVFMLMLGIGAALVIYVAVRAAKAPGVGHSGL